MELAGKVALVTGATGFVGERVARRLAREGMQVRGLTRRPVGPVDWEPVIGDVTCSAALRRAAEGADLVVHCAAVLFADEQECRRVNAEGTRLALEAAAASGCRRFVHLSTGAVYALAGRSVVDESTPFREGTTAYQRSKIDAERAVWAASSAGLGVTVLRPYFVLGAHPTAAWSCLLARRIVRGEFALAGDGSASWPYVHADNLAGAVALAARCVRAEGRAYNLADGQTTAGEYADHFRRWLGLTTLPARPELPVWRGRFDATRAVGEFSYAQRIGYEETLDEIHDFLQRAGMIPRRLAA
jgi:nucleoside-diphosphate-sugar epimerase